MASEEKIPLSTFVSRGISSLGSLIEILVGGTGTREELIASASSHLERFKLWVGSLGAHRESGPRSLEYKLRDASLIRKHIVTLLEDLCNSVDQAKEAVERIRSFTNIDDGLTKKAFSVTLAAEASLEGEEQQNEGNDIDDELAELFYDDDKDAIHRPELDQALGRIGHAVDCLLRLSATIRHPAPHDQFKSRAGAEFIESFQPFDKGHIRHKFMELDEPLVDRLVKAMAGRRQYFMYREEHVSRIARGMEGLKSNASENTTTKTVISSLPGHLKDNKITSDSSDMTDFYDVEVRSQTSYASTMAEPAELQVPRTPPESDKGPFKCPYCHMIIEINTRHEWKKHVFRDLQPYTCLEKTCTIPNQHYSRRSEWIRHMKNEHWRVWHCSLGCINDSFNNLEQLLKHNKIAHAGEMGSSGLRSQAKVHASSARDKSKARVRCSLCPKNAEIQLKSEKDYASHIGRHLENLALFALPRVDDDYSMGDERTDDEDDDDVARDLGEGRMEGDESHTSGESAHSVESEVLSKDGDDDGPYNQEQLSHFMFQCMACKYTFSAEPRELAGCPKCAYRTCEQLGPTPVESQADLDPSLSVDIEEHDEMKTHTAPSPATATATASPDNGHDEDSAGTKTRDTEEGIDHLLSGWTTESNLDDLDRTEPRAPRYDESDYENQRADGSRSSPFFGHLQLSEEELGRQQLMDYQMQLMLLEQQNKKRLMKARLEQDEMKTHTAPSPATATATATATASPDNGHDEDSAGTKTRDIEEGIDHLLSGWTTESNLDDLYRTEPRGPNVAQNLNQHQTMNLATQMFDESTSRIWHDKAREELSPDIPQVEVPESRFASDSTMIK